MNDIWVVLVFVLFLVAVNLVFTVLIYWKQK